MADAAPVDVTTRPARPSRLPVPDTGDALRTVSMFVKGIMTFFLSAFALGLTGDAWIALFVLVGYPAAWAAVWIINK
jgi:hypothetical protein